MKLKNNGASFTMVFSGKDYLIPTGEFEVFVDKLGFFILDRAMKWGKDIISIKDTKSMDIRPDVVAKVEPSEIVTKETINEQKDDEVQEKEVTKLKTKQRVEKDK
jgi:hypothetical protein